MAILARSWNWLFAFCIFASYFTIYLIFLRAASTPADGRRIWR